MRPLRPHWLPLALVLIGLAAPPAAAVTYQFSTPISGDTVAVTLELSDAAGGAGVDVTVSIPAGTGDLLGLFGNVVAESLVSGMGVEDPSGIVTQWQFQANKVWKVGGGNTMSPVKQWDWGLKLGETGSPGGSVVESASFRLTGPGITVAELVGAANQGFVFGVRIQGTSGAQGSAKIGMPEGTPPVEEPPTIAIAAPADGALLVASPVSVSGPVTGTAVSVDVNGTPATVTAGTFGASLPLADGVHTITATASNVLGSAGDAVTVTVDTTAPIVAISTPPDGAVTNLSPVTVSGTVADASAVTEVDINGVLVPVVAGTFTADVPLAEGANTITVTATDAAGHTGSASVGITLDTIAPAVAITAPPDGTLTTLSLATVTGTVTDAGTIVAVDVNGTPATLTGTDFTATVPLALGANVLTASATDAAGNTGTAQITLTRGDAPTVSITSPADGSLASQANLAVAGDAPGATAVDVNGVAATLSGTSFTATVTLLEGGNTVTATASNAFGQASDAISVTLDSTSPSITILSPTDGATVTSTPVVVSGGIVDASPITALTINGSPATPGNSFSEPVDLVQGPNTITVSATDAAGNVGSASISVTLAPPVPLAVAITSPGDGSATAMGTIGVIGTVSDPTAAVDVNGLAATVSGGTWSVSGVPLSNGSNLVTATAVRGPDTEIAQIVVVRETTSPPAPPPDPVASAIDPTVSTDLAVSTTFLYTGPNAVQTGVALGTIDPRRAGVIRGRVLTRGGAPLPSVRVTVKDHPEYGETLTRADGVFDLAVNGGGSLALELEREGYITILRRVEVAWRDFALVPDAVMLPPDPNATLIDLTAGSMGQWSPEGSAFPVAALGIPGLRAQMSGPAFQAAQGSIVSDHRGTRQISLLFQEGTSASVELSGGGTQNLDQLTIRTTEFTQGGFADFGDALPGPLASRIEPFMVFDVGADQATALGASRIDLSVPARFYSENFQGFAVGEPVRLADLDEGNTAWRGQAPGKVVDVVAVVNGVAEIDTDGDGVAESPSAVTAPPAKPGASR